MLGESQGDVYATGPERGLFSIDSELLEVHYGRAGRVERLELYDG